MAAPASSVSGAVIEPVQRPEGTLPVSALDVATPRLASTRLPAVGLGARARPRRARFGCWSRRPRPGSGCPAGPRFVLHSGRREVAVVTSSARVHLCWPTKAGARSCTPLPRLAPAAPPIQKMHNSAQGAVARRTCTHACNPPSLLRCCGSLLTCPRSCWARSEHAARSRCCRSVQGCDRPRVSGPAGTKVRTRLGIVSG